MTVQISVTVWTVLCFLGLMLILDRLLFRPLLRFMDARQEKIDRARARRESAQARREEELALRSARKAEQERAALAETAAQLQAIRQESAELARQKAAENARKLEEYKTALDKESQDIQRQLRGHIDQLSAAFAEGLEILVDTRRFSDPEDEVAAPHAIVHHAENTQ